MRTWFLLGDCGGRVRSKSDCLAAGGRAGGPSSPGTYRPIVVVAVIVKQTLLLLQVEADPVVEASDFALFHFACNTKPKVGVRAAFPSPSPPVYLYHSMPSLSPISRL